MLTLLALPAAMVTSRPVVAQEAPAAPAPAEPATGAVDPATLEDEGGAAELSGANEALYLKDYARAARLAHVSMTKTKPTAEKYESAQFALAEALDALGLSQAAAEYYFAVVEQRQNPALLSRALTALARLAEKDQIPEEQLLRGVLVEAELSNLPPEVADFLHYYRGLSNLRQGYRRWAEKDFERVNAEGEYARRVAMAQVITLVRDGKGDEAIDVYQRVGRTYDTPAGEVLLERAWAHFRGREYHDAMGLLYALGAPSNRDLFLPDQYVLRGLIYQRFCHFRAAKAAVADFRAKYGAAVAELKAGKRPLDVAPVARAADDLPDIAPAVRVDRFTRAEVEKLDAMASTLEEGGVLEHLRALYTVLRNRSAFRLQLARDAGAAKSAERLLDADEQANLLEYEVGVSIFRPIRDATGKIGVRDKAETVPGGGTRTYYPFDGEFWSDELPDMRFLIQDRCVE